VFWFSVRFAVRCSRFVVRGSLFEFLLTHGRFDEWRISVSTAFRGRKEAVVELRRARGITVADD
jgi:hypothetical protein